jgi:radical SAM superfamily enzyme YgiQ (UPF0313 family)
MTMKSSKPQKIVLYNPRADFYTLPLALLALASALDRKRYRIVLVDGRLEAEPELRVARETVDALCLGVTVLTGKPLRDALRVTKAAKAARADLPVVWGGWHPSLFPVETLLDAGVDATVQGQGERTLAEILDRLEEGASLDGVPGCTARRGIDPAVGAPRTTADLNEFPAVDYDLLDLEPYFARKGQRQLDYVSSQGCRFRCTFCSDPTVYRRAWFGLAPGRVGEELERAYRRHRFDDLAFQDETFFTQERRIAAIASEIRKRGLAFRWMATMRADQGARLDEKVLVECREAGLRRVMIGLESGSQPMLDWMKKDVKLEQVFTTAEKCRRAGVGALFNLIVGFPRETADSVGETIRIAKRLRAMGPDFQVAFFYYKPYPGTEIVDALAKEGHPLPRRLEEWAGIEDAASPWVDSAKRALVERFKFYQQVAWARPTPLRAPLQALARWRCDRDFYGLPLEKAMVEWLRPLAPQG